MPKTFIESTLAKKQDEGFEVPLRPQNLDDFAGQDNIRKRLSILIQAARERGEPLGHCLFSGPPGLGKTTLANILAHAMGTRLVVTSGPVLEKPGDLAGVLTNLQEGDILFIDEIHRINRSIEEYLYSAMEDFSIDLMIDSGPSARSVQVKINPFSLVGATTRTGLLTAPLRTRFAFSCRLEYYEPDVLTQILKRTGLILNLELDQEGAREIAMRSRGTPRVGNNLLRWVRDYSQVHAAGTLSPEIVRAALDMLAIDAQGLDEMDKKILNVLIKDFEGGPVGLKTLAIAVGEEAQTLEEVYEPYLILLGLIKKTARGREATARASKHLQEKE